MKILVVEDIPDFLHLLVNFFEDIGAEVYPAASVNQAVYLLRSGIAFDIVCTDFNLSDQNPRHNGNLVATYADELGFKEIYLLSGDSDVGEDNLFTRKFNKLEIDIFMNFMTERVSAKVTTG